MQQSLELYFLLNFTVDAALFAVIARVNGCFRTGNVALAASIGAVYALTVETACPVLAHPFIQLLLIACLSLLITQSPDFFRWGSVGFQLFCGAALTGGFGGLFPEHMHPVAIACGLLCLSLLMSLRRRRLMTWDVTVLLSLRGRSVSFQALIDTGNRLHEPISGLPVLIVEDTLLAGLMPDDGDSLPCRRIAFGGLGGSGAMQCFRPDDVLIRRDGRLIQAPSVWVAAYPGRIPGAARALAPPSFAVIRGAS